jgi:hypothetical protein
LAVHQGAAIFALTNAKAGVLVIVCWAASRPLVLAGRFDALKARENFLNWIVHCVELS